MSQTKILAGSRFYPDHRLPLAVVRDRGGPHERHGHDFVEIVLVTRGRGLHLRYPPPEQRDRGTTPLQYELIENDVLLVPLGWSHGYTRREDLEFYNLLFDPELLAHDPLHRDAVEGLFTLFSGQSPSDGTGLVYKLHLRPAQREAMEACLRTILGEITARQSGYELLAKAKLLEVLVLLNRAALSAPIAPSVFRDHAHRRAVPDAITYIEDHFSESISLDDLAGIARLSLSHFCESFKLGTGLSPGKYMTRVRLEHAKGLLLTTNLPVTDIAMESGFSDSSYFTRVFRTAQGMTPRTFRENGRLS